MDNVEISYAAAIAEVEQIVKAMQDSSLDVDRLGSMVARATELVELCKAKLQVAQMEVEKIVEKNA